MFSGTLNPTQSLTVSLSALEMSHYKALYTNQRILYFIPSAVVDEARTVNVKDESGSSGTEPVRRLAAVPAGVAEPNVAHPQRGVDGPMSHPAVVHALSVLPPLHQRGGTAGVQRTRQTQRGADRRRQVSLIGAAQLRRSCNTNAFCTMTNLTFIRHRGRTQINTACKYKI